LSCDPPFKRFLASLGADLLDSATIFRTAGSEPGPKGGQRRLPQPYSTSKMDRDFREIHRAVFGPDEERQLADMRRSGALEADAVHRQPPAHCQTLSMPANSYCFRLNAPQDAFINNKMSPRY
jgi:hypothetical protein